MQSPDLDAIFSALADPTRRAILLRLTLGEATVNELAEPFAISLPAISRHLKVLERAGLITRGKEAQFRPCRLETDQLKEAFDWLERYRRHWEESFDRLDEVLEHLMREESGGVPADQQQPRQRKRLPGNEHRRSARESERTPTETWQTSRENTETTRNREQ